jgi:hypothetical protein
VVELQELSDALDTGGADYECLYYEKYEPTAKKQVAETPPNS